MVIKFAGISYSLDFFSRKEVIDLRRRMEDTLNHIANYPDCMLASQRLMKDISAINSYLDERILQDHGFTQ